MQSQKAIDAAAQQRSHGKEGAESAVAQNDVPLAEMRPELPKELTFVHAKGAAGKIQERSAFEAEKTHKFHHGKAACFFLIGRLRIGSLILRGVRHRQAGAIDDFDLAGKPAALTGGVGFHALSEMAMDVQKHGIGKPLTGLTVGAGVRGHLPGERSIHQACTLRTASRQSWAKALEREMPRR